MHSNMWELACLRWQRLGEPDAPRCLHRRQANAHMCLRFLQRLERYALERHVQIQRGRRRAIAVFVTPWDGILFG